MGKNSLFSVTELKKKLKEIDFYYSKSFLF